MSYHCDVPRYTDLAHVDPSLLIGHLFTKVAEFDAFCLKYQSLESSRAQAFSIMESSPMLNDSLEVYSIESNESEND